MSFDHIAAARAVKPPTYFDKLAAETRESVLKLIRFTPELRLVALAPGDFGVLARALVKRKRKLGALTASERRGVMLRRVGGEVTFARSDGREIARVAAEEMQASLQRRSL